jgi:hypothetical protein
MITAIRGLMRSTRTVAVYAIALVATLASSASGVSAQRAAAALQRATLPAPVIAGPALDRALMDGAPHGGWHTLRIAKWTVAGVTAGTALYGFISNNRADDLYRELEVLCVADPLRCLSRTSDGAYTDAELESRYQEMRDVDRRARSALLVGQVGVAASVALFILDLRNRNGPSNIPYEPPGLSLRPATDGGFAVGWSLRR